MSMAKRKHLSNSTQQQTTFLNRLLPPNWGLYFSQTGRGLTIKCPNCDQVPPRELSGYRKWRWMSVHIAGHRHLKVEK